MRATDVFAIAAAVVIALLTLIVEPWSLEWWIGLITAATIAFATAVAVIPGKGRALLQAWMPWVLIVGGPVLGVLWLVLQPSATVAQGPLFARLAELGWTVKPGENETEFEVMDRAMPSMKESAALFAQLSKPFNLHLHVPPSIDGINYLSGVVGLTRIAIGAGKFTDISELRGFTHLTRLTLSQLPYEGVGGVVDTEPLSSLVNLQELNLNDSKVQNAGFLASLPKLKILNIPGTPIRDISAASALTSLEKLDIRGSQITDLRPLNQNPHLAELSISGSQVPGLASFTNANLKSLFLWEYQPVDFTPIGALTSLESLTIMGPPRFEVSALQKLGKLKQLRLSGPGFGSIAVIQNAQMIGGFDELTSLILGSFPISDLSFVGKLKSLTELYVSEMPITSLGFVRSLTALKKISFSDVPLVDISPLLEVPQLAELSLLRVPARTDVIKQLEGRGVTVKSH